MRTTGDGRGAMADGRWPVNVYRHQFAWKLTDKSQNWYYEIAGGAYDSEARPDFL